MELRYSNTCSCAEARGNVVRLLVELICLDGGLQECLGRAAEVGRGGQHCERPSLFHPLRHCELSAKVHVTPIVDL